MRGFVGGSAGAGRGGFLGIAFHGIVSPAAPVNGFNTNVSHGEAGSAGSLQGKGSDQNIGTE